VEGFEAAVFRGGRNLLKGPAPPTILFEFNDWAEKEGGFRAGEAQEVLLDWGYTLWVLADYQRRGPSLDAPILSGSHMLVARRL
jgi:hypothetical protein